MHYLCEEAAHPPLGRHLSWSFRRARLSSKARITYFFFRPFGFCLSSAALALMSLLSWRSSSDNLRRVLLWRTIRFARSRMVRRSSGIAQTYQTC
jgi:hypothetical protein